MRDRFWITSRLLMENNYMTDSQPGVHPGRDHLQVYPPLPEDSQVMEVEEQVQATPQQRAPMVPMPTAPPPTPAGTEEENTAPILPEIRPRQRQDLADTLLIPTPMVGIVIQPSVWNSQLRKSPLPAPGEGTQLTSTLRNGEMPPTQNLNMSVSFMDEEEEDSEHVIMKSRGQKKRERNVSGNSSRASTATKPSPKRVNKNRSTNLDFFSPRETSAGKLLV